MWNKTTFSNIDKHHKPARGPTIDETKLVTIPARFGSWF